MTNIDFNTAFKEMKNEKKPHVFRYAFFLVLFLIAAVVVSYIYMDYQAASLDDQKDTPPGLPDGTNSVAASNEMPSAPTDIFGSGGSQDENSQLFPGFPES